MSILKVVMFLTLLTLSSWKALAETTVCSSKNEYIVNVDTDTNKMIVRGYEQYISGVYTFYQSKLSKNYVLNLGKDWVRFQVLNDGKMNLWLNDTVSDCL